MGSNFLKYFKISVMLAIIFIFAWFIMVYPTYKFQQYESQMKKAAERYYEINKTKQPTGNRVATVSLQTLFRESYLKEDFYIPYTKKACSPTKSWVKTTKKDNKFKYYIYLECGALKSTVDHKGPKIELNGKTETTIEVGNDYKDPGIKKIYDKKDGNIEIESAIIKSNLDTKNIGEYEIEYSATDKLGNKTTETRKITVVNTLKSQLKKMLNKEKRFKGIPANNNINIYNMQFKIVGLDEDNNVILVTENPISYINYSKIDEWINDYYYKLLSKEMKNMIVESKFCKSVKDANSTECTSETEKRKIYYPSVQDINLANQDGANFMKTEQLSWVNLEKDNPIATGTFNEDFYNELYEKMEKDEIATIRPMFKIKGTIKILTGDGSYKYPFEIIKDNKRTGDKKTSDLRVGDVIKNKGIKYRVIENTKAGVKVISCENISTYTDIVKIKNTQNTPLIYNPNQKDNIGYKINNDLTRYVDKTLFAKHTIDVPIYKKNVIYGKEESKKTYKVLYSAPNIFELYTTANFKYDEELAVEGSNWFINSSKETNSGVVADNYGNVNDYLYKDDSNGIRVVAYLKDDLQVTSGFGSFNKPYTFK